jgi:type II secretion system protein N
MNNFRSWLILSVYIVSAAAFFIYCLFPSDAVTAYITKKMNTINPAFSIRIDHVNPVFPPGLRFHAVSLYHADTALFSVDKMKVAPDLLSVFREKTTFFFKGRVHEGILEGTVDISGNEPARNVDIFTHLSKIEINDIPLIRNVEEIKLSGTLNGDVAYRRDRNTGGSGTAALSIAGGSFTLFLPFYNPGSLSFRSLEADLVIKDRMLKLNRCVINGNQADGRLSGTITLEDPIGESILNLTGTLIPQPAFFKGPGKDLMEIFNLKKGPDVHRFSLKITGTLDAPAVLLN